jgi:hypothetical protein
VVIVGAILLSTYRLLCENQALAGMRPQPRQSLDAVIEYLGLFQGWSMFGPDAPQRDLSIAVDAVTVTGRHIDPLNMAASANHQPGLQVPAHLGQSSMFGEYIRTICWENHLHHILVDWMGRHHLRTGSASDRIVSFHLYAVEDDSPLPGENAPRNTRVRRCLSHRY